MSFKNLGNKQTIVLHNCEIDNKKYDLVITPHTQKVGYIRTKRQTIERKIINKQRQITRKRLQDNTAHRKNVIQTDKSHEKDFQKIETHFLNQKPSV